MTRQQLGLTREVVQVVPGDRLDVVLMKCGHWFRVHRGKWNGAEAGCTGCDALERLAAMLDAKNAEIAALREEKNAFLEAWDRDDFITGLKALDRLRESPTEWSPPPVPPGTWIATKSMTIRYRWHRHEDWTVTRVVSGDRVAPCPDCGRGPTVEASSGGDFYRLLETWTRVS